MRGIEQLGSSFGPAVLFPNENSWGGGVGGGIMLIVAEENPLSLALGNNFYNS